MFAAYHIDVEMTVLFTKKQDAHFKITIHKTSGRWIFKMKQLIAIITFDSLFDKKGNTIPANLYIADPSNPGLHPEVEVLCKKLKKETAKIQARPWRKPTTPKNSTQRREAA